MTEHSFSVLIAVYNGEKYIDQALDYVRNQTYKNYEIIVVDDGSKEPLEPYINAYKERYPDLAIHFMRQENQGISGARHTTIGMAHNEYIAIFDVDDAWMPNKLERMNELINEHEAEVYYHDEYEIWEDTPDKKTVLRYRQLPEDAVTDLILNGTTISPSGVVIDREFITKVEPFKDKHRSAEDYECWIRLAKAGARFYHTDDILGEYRRVNDAITVKDPYYVEQTNERIVGFYDYLDPDKFSKDEIEELKAKRRAFNEYLMGRYYHRKKDYAKAKEYYKKSKEMGNNGKKRLAASVLASLHIRI